MAKKSPAKKATKKSVKKVVKKIATEAKPKKVVKKAAKKTSVKSVKFTAHQTHLKAGDKAPYFECKEQGGNTISLTGLTGKTIILYFYPKDDTPGCTATACSLRDEYKLLNKSNYAVVGVSADNEKSHAKFAAKYELPFPLLADVDHKIMKAYDVWGKKQFMGRIFDGIIRTTFIIGPDGIIKEVINKVDTANHAQQILNA
jgi:peroxiredoxin Q/BCP